MAGPYDLFKTDDKLETEGITLNYGDQFKIRVARAGGGNKRYAKVLEAKTRPYRRMIQTGTLDDATDLRIMAEVFAEAVVLGWENVKDKDGNVMVFSKENVVKLLTDLPDLFADIRVQASQVQSFRDDEKDVDSKN